MNCCCLLPCVFQLKQIFFLAHSHVGKGLNVSAFKMEKTWSQARGQECFDYGVLQEIVYFSSTLKQEVTSSWSPASTEQNTMKPKIH
jgi:hypothetical protein